MTIHDCAGATVVRLLAATALVTLCVHGYAAEPDAVRSSEAAQLREQVSQLRQMLERLDERLQQIERAPAAVRGAAAGTPGPTVETATSPPRFAPDPASPAGSAIPPAAPAMAPLGAHEQAVLQQQVRTADAMSAWRAVRNGMRQEEIRHLLGEPQSTLLVGNRTGWVYAYRNIGNGSVIFDHDGVVISLMSPGQGAQRMF